MDKLKKLIAEYLENNCSEYKWIVSINFARQAIDVDAQYNNSLFTFTLGEPALRYMFAPTLDHIKDTKLHSLFKIELALFGSSGAAELKLTEQGKEMLETLVINNAKEHFYRGASGYALSMGILPAQNYKGKK
jgi:hypothetical protein